LGGNAVEQGAIQGVQKMFEEFKANQK